jgi:hypothetical protein
MDGLDVVCTRPHSLHSQRLENMDDGGGGDNQIQYIYVHIYTHIFILILQDLPGLDILCMIGGFIVHMPSCDHVAKSEYLLTE